MNDLIQTIGRLRRAMPRNGDVATVCDALESSLRQGSAQVRTPKLTRAEIQRRYRLRKKAAA
jgi:hypothetical protein